MTRRPPNQSLPFPEFSGGTNHHCSHRDAHGTSKNPTMATLTALPINVPRDSATALEDRSPMTVVTIWFSDRISSITIGNKVSSTIAFIFHAGGGGADESE